MPTVFIFSHAVFFILGYYLGKYMENEFHRMRCKWRHGHDNDVECYDRARLHQNDTDEQEATGN